MARPENYIPYNKGTALSFIEKANKIHKNYYDYSKVIYTNSTYIIGIALITTNKLSIPINISLNNTNVDNLQYIPSNELHLYPHLFI